MAAVRRPGLLVRGVIQRLPAVVLSALFAHSVVYKSLWPTDGEHGYFAWYAPLVGALSAVAMLGVPVLLVLALRCGRGDGTPARVARALLPREGGLGETARLASGALGFLVLQEAAEHSFRSHHPAVPAFSAGAWLVVTATIVCVAAVLGWVGAAVSGALESMDAEPRVVHGVVRRVSLRGVARHRRRSQPLAVHGALRGPPRPV
jgi:hypothetical protein